MKEFLTGSCDWKEHAEGKEREVYIVVRECTEEIMAWDMKFVLSEEEEKEEAFCL